MHSPSPDALLADLQQRCRERGIPLTVQRRAAYAALALRDDHPTADQVFADLAARVPGISKATAYRTLDTLVELGLVVRVSHPGSVARYDAKTFRHHHLVCDACGAVADLESAALDRVALPDLSRRGFVTRDFSIHVRGLCHGCAPAKRRGAARATKSSPGKNRRNR